MGPKQKMSIQILKIVYKSIQIVKEAHAAFRHSRETLMHHKTARCHKNDKNSLVKALNLSRAAGMVQQHIHWTFMYMARLCLTRSGILLCSITQCL
jgi:hypothetical protein